MKTVTRRSDCPINFSLQHYGDLWSLLIVRDIVYFGKKTYGDFLASDEHIATNILASRLTQLVKDDILKKEPHTLDKRKEIFVLTEKGLDLVPILLELANWGAKYDTETGAPKAWIDLVNTTDKKSLITLIRKTVRKGGSIFVGENSVISKLSN